MIKPPDTCTLPPCPHRLGLNCTKCYPVQWSRDVGGLYDHRVRGPYVSAEARNAHPMGQFQVWCSKLFYYSGPFLGWRYLRGIS